MLHYNEELRRFGSWALLNLFLPQMYDAVSVHDFVEHRSLVAPTGFVLSPFLFFYGSACVLFQNVSFRRGSNDRHTLYDLTDEIEVEISSLATSRIAKQHLTGWGSPLPDGRLFEAQVLYVPADDRTYLFDAKRFGPLEPEQERRELSDRLQPAPAHS